MDKKIQIIVLTVQYLDITSIKRPHGKGKYQSMDNTKIGIKVDNSY